MRIAIGPIGIHSFYSKEFISSNNYSDASEKYNDVATLVHNYLNEVRVSTALLEHMKRVPHYDLYILQQDELSAYGLFGIDPVYVQVTAKKGSAASENPFLLTDEEIAEAIRKKRNQ